MAATGQKPVVVIHTNDQQLVPALVGAYSLKARSKNPEFFEVRILRLEETPHLYNREGQKFVWWDARRTAVWRRSDLQSFAPLRRMVPELLGFVGRALVLDPDVFAIGDVNELLSRGMDGRAILCRPRQVHEIPDVYRAQRSQLYSSAVMLLDCAQLRNWDWARDIDALFSCRLKLTPWLSLMDVPSERIGLFEEEWNDRDTLTPDTKLLHNTEISTQPWKTGLRADYHEYAPRGPMPLQWLTHRAVRLRHQRTLTPLLYRPHPDPAQEDLFFGLLNEALESGEISERLVRRAIRRRHLRSDTFALLRERRRSARPGPHGRDRRRMPSARLLNAARNLAVDRVTAEVVAALDAAGIPSILLKGPSIARWLYPEGGRRYCDTDLLVQASDRPRAVDVLGAMGFTDRLQGFHPFERSAMPTAATSFVRAPSVGDGRGGDVDLHRNLPSLSTPDDVLWEVLNTHVTTLEVGGRPVRVLDHTGVALHVVLHAVQEGFRLHTEEDLRRAVATLSLSEWEAVAALAERLGVANVVGRGLRHHPAGVDIADRLGLPQLVVEESPYRWALLGGPRGVTSLEMVREAQTWTERLRLARWAIVPSAAKVRYVYAMPDAGRGSTIRGYVRWWQDLAKASVPAAKFVARVRARGD
jgi:hypothetical protein